MILHQVHREIEEAVRISWDRRFRQAELAKIPSEAGKLQRADSSLPIASSSRSASARCSTCSTPRTPASTPRSLRTRRSFASLFAEYRLLAATGELLKTMSIAPAEAIGCLRARRVRRAGDGRDRDLRANAFASGEQPALRHPGAREEKVAWRRVAGRKRSDFEPHQNIRPAERRLQVVLSADRVVSRAAERRNGAVFRRSDRQRRRSRSTKSSTLPSASAWKSCSSTIATSGAIASTCRPLSSARSPPVALLSETPGGVPALSPRRKRTGARRSAERPARRPDHRRRRILPVLREHEEGMNVGQAQKIERRHWLTGTLARSGGPTSVWRWPRVHQHYRAGLAALHDERL